jgi:hypothetical protein
VANSDTYEVGISLVVVTDEDNCSVVVLGEGVDTLLGELKASYLVVGDVNTWAIGSVSGDLGGQSGPGST